ncbi:hypothetical protein [Arenicella xantha]|uniref:Uncharacterized protein n=1 Tax=Arenicella xantha TaxID=644221 RepID=A0A395JIT7_9GAMM|nr:hypothetical protein [Arenicella xantha]RBP48541.1 hypothetical protein DFR28_10627 [Arenicella xantha]
MRTIKGFCCVAVLTLVPFSLVKAETDYAAYSRKGFDECFDKTLSGEKIVVPCEQPSPEMTPAEIQESIDQFRSFEDSDLVEAVFEAALKRDALPKTESPFGQKIKPNESAKQKSIRIERIRKHFQFQSQFKPEVAQKMGGIRDGLYFVRLVFVNDADFPPKYSRNPVFIENQTEEFAVSWKETIFTHYLKSDYEKFTPELGAIGEFVVMTVLLRGSNDLQQIVTGQPLHTISHIGTPVSNDFDDSSYLPSKIKE